MRSLLANVTNVMRTRGKLARQDTNTRPRCREHRNHAKKIQSASFDFVNGRILKYAKWLSKV